MATYVEQAVLRVQDKATRPVKKLNRELKSLRDTADRLSRTRISFGGLLQTINDVERLRTKLRQLNDKRVRLTFTGIAQAKADLRGVEELVNKIKGTRRIAFDAKGPTSALAQVREFRNIVNALAARKTLSLRITTPGVTLAISKLKQVRELLKDVQAGATVPVRAPGRPRVTPPGASAAADGNRQSSTSFADGVRSALRPAQMGRDMARGFAFGIRGELFQLGRQVALSAGGAPLRREDAEKRLAVQGRSDSEIAFVASLAEGLSEGSQVTAADLIGNSGDFLGRINDITTEAGQRVATTVLARFAKNAQILTSALGVTSREAAEQARIIETNLQQLGVSSDPEQSAALSEAIIKSIVASGGDVTASMMKRMLQQLSSARIGASPATLQQFALSLDEEGRRGTGEFRQLFTDLFRSTLSDKATEKQAEFGIRNADGSANAEMMQAFSDNFLQNFVAKISNKLEALGIDVTDSTAVTTALSNQLGFVKEGGIATLTRSIVNFDDAMAEFNRAQKVTPNVALDPERQTTTDQARKVATQFQNLAADVLGPITKNLIEPALDALQESLGKIAQGEGGVTDFTTALAGVIPVGVGAAVSALAEAESAPLAAASLGLLGSSAALDASAAALTAAAVAQGAGGAVDGADGRGRGRRGGNRRGLASRAGAAATAAAGTVSKASAPVARVVAPVALPVAVAVEVLRPSELGDGTVTGQSSAVQEARELVELNTEIVKGLQHELKFLTAKMSLGAAQPGNPHAQLTPQELANMAEVKSKLPAAIKRLEESEANLDELSIAAREGLETGSMSLQDAFDVGTTSLTEASGHLGIVGDLIGPSIVTALEQNAGQIGNQIGNAAAQRIQNANIGIRVQQQRAAPPLPTLDTGGSNPF